MRRGIFIFIALLGAWLAVCAFGAKAFLKSAQRFDAANFLAANHWVQIEPCTPTAPLVPSKKQTLDRLLGSRTQHKAAKATYVRLNRQTPCPPRSAVSANQAEGWRCFTLHPQFAFDNGGDLPSYVPVV